MPGLLGVLNSPWAITPEKLQVIQQIYIKRVANGHPLTKEVIEAALDGHENDIHKVFQIVNGNAIIPIEGTIAKRMNLFHSVSGGASTEMIKKDIDKALNDPTVNRIILNIDSPGGAVGGINELAMFIREIRNKKSIIAFSDGVMTSAAYWIGSAASEVVISGDTVTVGSIGVVASHVDVSENDKMKGIKVTEITAGKFKRIVSEHEKLSVEGRKSIQEQLDYIYSVFVGVVAENRNTGVDTVLKDMADGRLFIGRQGIEAGLVDRIASLEDLIGEVNNSQGMGNAIVNVSNNSSGVINNNNIEGDVEMEKLIAMLGLAADATEDQVMEAVKAIQKSKEASSARAAEESEKLAKVMTQLSEVTKMANEAVESSENMRVKLLERDRDEVIGAAIKSFKILPKNESKWNERFMKDPEDTKELIDTLQPAFTEVEKGSGEDSTVDSVGAEAVNSIDRKAKEIVAASNGSISYTQATKQAFAEVGSI